MKLPGPSHLQLNSPRNLIKYLHLVSIQCKKSGLIFNRISNSRLCVHFVDDFPVAHDQLFCNEVS